jgi:general secretion pathway protein I
VRRLARGFTLIEVLVALAIVTIGMAAVMGALNSSANTVSYLRDKSFAQWVALNQIATIRVSGTAPPLGNSDGDVDFAGTSYHWRMEVVGTQIPGMVRMDVHVRPKDMKGDDNGPWYTTLSGIYGDAVGIPNGYQPMWGAQVLPGQGPAVGNNRGTIGGQGGIGSVGSGTLGVQGGLGSQGAPATGTGLGGSSTLGGSSSLGGSGSLGGTQGDGLGQTLEAPPSPPPPDEAPEPPQ